MRLGQQPALYFIFHQKFEIMSEETAPLSQQIPTVNIATGALRYGARVNIEKPLCYKYAGLPNKKSFLQK